MKAGDKVWARVEVNPVLNDGTFLVGCGGIHEDDDVIPEHPALPAVARWLAEHGQAIAGNREDVELWFDYFEGVVDDGKSVEEGINVRYLYLPALRALIAALTEVAA